MRAIKPLAGLRRFSGAPRVELDLFVRNVPFAATEEDILRCFKASCDVQKVVIASDRESGASRGFAFVTVTGTSVKGVLTTLNGMAMGGRRIGVELASAQLALAPDTHDPAAPLTNRLRSDAIARNRRLVACGNASDVLQLFVDEGDDFDFMNLATALHRLGALSETLDPASAPAAQRLAAACAASIKSEEWSPQGLANAVWGLARVGAIVEAPALFEAAAVAALKKMDAFNSQALANTVWAYATAGISAPAMFKAVAKEAPKRINTFRPQALANTAWAFAKAGFQAPLLFEVIALEAPKKIREFTSQDLANMAWAYSTVGASEANFALFQAVKAEAPRKIETFKPQELANMAWAFADSGILAPAMFRAVAAESRLKIAEFVPQSLASIVWAFAKARMQAPPLFEAVALEATPKMHNFFPQSLANMLWAYAAAGIEAPLLFEAAAAEVTKRIGKFHAHDLANIVWAYSTAGVDAPALFEAAAPRIDAKIGEFSPPELSLLQMVYLHLRLEAPRHSLTLSLSRYEAELRAASIRQESDPSQFHHEVSAALTGTGWDHDFEYITDEGLVLDMAQPSRKFAVEFDGPARTFAGVSPDGTPTRVLDGQTRAKERLLRRLGWTVVRIPRSEWKKLQSSDAREAYLRGKTSREESHQAPGS